MFNKSETEHISKPGVVNTVWKGGDPAPLGVAAASPAEPETGRVGVFLTCDVTPSVCWCHGEGAWPRTWTLCEPVLMLGGLRNVTTQGQKQRYFGVSQFVLLNWAPTHHTQTHTAYSGSLTEQRPCLSGSEAQNTSCVISAVVVGVSLVSSLLLPCQMLRGIYSQIQRW